MISYEKISLLRKYFSFVLTISLFGLCIHCRKPSVKEQVQGKVIVPDYPSIEGKPFFLSEAPFAKAYHGQLLVWDPEIENRVDLMQQMIHFSFEYNGLYTKRLLYFADEINPIEKLRLPELRNEKDTLQAQKSAGQLGFRKAASRTLFTNRTANMVPPLNEGDKAIFTTMFSDFCEAKIWEYLFYSKDWNRLIQSTYTERPTPFELCEGYYEEKGLLSRNTPDCAPSSDSVNTQERSPAGKSYLWCFWTEGVLKTKFFQRYDSTRQSDLGQFSEADLLKFSTMAAITYAKILGQNGKVTGANNRRFDFTANNSTTLSYSPDDALKAFSKEPVKASLFWTLTKEAQDQLLSNGILFDLALFALPSPGEKTQKFVSISDYVFNNVPTSTSILATDEATFLEVQIKFPEIFEATDPELDRQIANIQENVTSLEESLKDMRANTDKLSEDLQETMNARTLLANEPGITIALFSDIDVAIKQVQIDLFLVELRFQLSSANSHPIRGCFDISKSSQVECPKNSDGTEIAADQKGNEEKKEALFVPTKLVMDDITGKITIAFLSNDPELLGLNPRDRQGKDSVNFNAIRSSVIRDSVIEIELFANQWEGLVNFMTGNFFVKDQKTLQKTYSGNFELRDSSQQDSVVLRR